MQGDVLDLRWILAVIRRWFWLILLCLAVGLGVAYGVVRSVPPTYSASSTLLIQAAVTDFQAIMTSERLASTYSQLLKERTVLDAVIADLQLEESPTELSSRIKVSPLADTQLIRITVEHKDPHLAARIANSLTTAFIEQVKEYDSERYSEPLESIRQQMDQTSTEIDATIEEIDALSNPFTRAEQTEQARLEGLLLQHRATYHDLLLGYEQMRLSAAQSLQTVLVAEAARVPSQPNQQTLVYLSLAGLVSVVVGLGAAYLAEHLDDTVRTSEDVARALGLKTLGTVGILSKHERSAIIATNHESPNGEAFRVLAANISFSGSAVPLRTVLVTSATPMEGKSLVAANLAAALADSGLRVVLVEADMRRPAIRNHFELDPDKHGLSDALLHGALNGLLQGSAVEGLSILDGGQMPGNPSRLLSSPNVTSIIEQLSDRSDVVVIDSPPVLPVADTMLLARHADGILLVLRAGQTRWQLAKQAVDRLRQVGGQITGVVLNGVSGRSEAYSYGYYYASSQERPSDQNKPVQVLAEQADPGD